MLVKKLKILSGVYCGFNDSASKMLKKCKLLYKYNNSQYTLLMFWIKVKYF